jgi:hypothetical protein
MKGKRFGVIAAIVALLGLTAYLYFARAAAPAARTKYIAYIGRYTNRKDTIPIERQEKNGFDLLHEAALRDYLKEINHNSGTLHLELKTFDNSRDAHLSDSIYRNVIAKDDDIVMVIDNTWGEHLLPCAPAIRDLGIPVIAMNADRNNGDFGSNAIFTGNDDDVPGDIAAYLRTALKVSRVNMVGEIDYPLHNGFIERLKEQGIAIDREWDFAGKSDTAKAGVDTLLRQMVELYRRQPALRSTPILLNVHSNWGDRIIATLDSALDGVMIVGGAYIISAAAVQQFGRHRDNQLLIMSRPTDALSKEISNDLERFREASPKIFQTPSASFLLKRCQTAAEIIAGCLADSARAASPGKRSFLEYFRTLRGARIVGEHDLYEFDSTLVMLKDVYFSKYRGGKYYSLPIQLNRQLRPIPNIFFGIDVQDIYNIDANSNTFKSDFFYWVKLDTAFRDAEKYILFQNIKQGASSRELVMERIEDETLYRLYKVSGEFNHYYELRDYPLDQQELAIQVEILNPSDRLRISFDQSSLDQDQKIFDRFKVRAWQKLKYYVTVDNRITTTMRGDPENQEGRPTVFRNFAFRLLVRRKLLGPFLEIILPLSLIGFVSISTLYIRDISFENLGEVSVGTFLGIITFSIALSYVTPSSDYLTKADILFWLTFIVVLTSFMTVIVINSRYRLEQLEGVSIRPISYVLTLLYPILIALLLLL